MKRKETKTEEAPVEEVPQEEVVLPVPCNAPAPLVVNGGQYVGCQGIAGHEGNHEVRINWPS